jgi:cysteine desulfurase
VDQDGGLDLEALRSSLSEDTALVTVMLPTMKPGDFPIEEIGEIVKARDIPLHVPSKPAGKLALDVKLSRRYAHYFRTPRPQGVSPYVRRGLHFRHFDQRAPGQPARRRKRRRDHRYGCAELALLRLALMKRRAALRDRLIIDFVVPMRASMDWVRRLPNTSNIGFVLGRKSILVLLDQQGICASTGSACTAGSSDPSCFTAMNVPADWLQGAVRFSLSRLNTAEEVSYVNEKLPGIVQRLKGLSALGKLGSQPESIRSGAPGTIGARG